MQGVSYSIDIRILSIYSWNFELIVDVKSMQSVMFKSNNKNRKMTKTKS